MLKKILKSIVSDDNKEIILYKELYTVKYYTNSIKKLINSDIIIWNGQRDINEDHINRLYKSLKDTNTLMGSYKIIIQNDSKSLLIDGQHRLETIKRYIDNENKEYDDEILIEEYQLNNCHTELIFTMANTILGLKESEFPIDKTKFIMDNLIRIYPNLFKQITIKNKRVNRPRIDIQKFNQYLQSIFYDNKDIDEKKFLNNIITHNNNLENGIINIPITHHMLLQARKLNCYLGLHYDLEWLNELI